MLHAAFVVVPSWISRVPLGARYMVGSALGLSLMGLFVKLAGQRLPTSEMMVARSLVTLALSYHAVRRAGLTPWGTRPGLLTLRGAVGTTAMFCVYYSVSKLPLAEATVIQFCHPVVTALLAPKLIGERASPGVWIALLLSMLGVTLVAQPGWLVGQGAPALNPLAVLVAVIGAVLSSFAYLLVRTLARTEDPQVIIFYFPLVALPVSLPLLLADPVLPHGVEWLWLLLLGLATQMGQVLLTRGLRELTVGRAAAYSYAQVVFAACWGLLVFDAAPDALSYLGAALIFAGSFAATRAPEAPLSDSASVEPTQEVASARKGG